MIVSDDSKVIIIVTDTSNMSSGAVMKRAMKTLYAMLKIFDSMFSPGLFYMK